MSRYQRQSLLSQFSGEAQGKIDNARALIVGMGGLGSPVSNLLAGAGVGNITIVDGDTVSLSNLHRQTLYTEQDIDELKVTAAKKRLEAVNSNIKIHSIAEHLSIQNAEQLVKNASVVIDAADSFFVTYLLSDLCYQHRIPLVSASVLKTQGYLGVFCGTQSKPAPSYRAVFNSPGASAQSCDTVGVTGPSVGIIGSLQAQEALKVIIKDSSALLGKIMYLDLWDYQQRIIDFSKAEEPKIHNQWSCLEQLSESDILIDVRQAEEIAAEPTPATNARVIHKPLLELETLFSELDKSAPICCVCKSGQRALNAANQLIAQGFSNISVSSR